MIETAIISVYDKTGIVEFAEFLRDYDVNLVSTGGTCKLLREKGLKVTSIEEITGKPEILGGRVKTLQYEIQAPILAKHNEEDLSVLKKIGLKPFDMVVCNLYPFEETVKKGYKNMNAIKLKPLFSYWAGSPKDTPN